MSKITWKVLYRTYRKVCEDYSHTVVPNKVTWLTMPVSEIKGILISQDPYAFLINGKPLATPVPMAAHTSHTPYSLRIIKDAFARVMKSLRMSTRLSNNLEEFKSLGILTVNAIPLTKLGTPNGLNFPFIIGAKSYLPHDITAEFVEEVINKVGRVPILCMGREAERVGDKLSLPYYSTIHPGAVNHGGEFDYKIFKLWLTSIL